MTSSNGETQTLATSENTASEALNAQPTNEGGAAEKAAPQPTGDPSPSTGKEKPPKAVAKRQVRERVKEKPTKAGKAKRSGKSAAADAEDFWKQLTGIRTPSGQIWAKLGGRAMPVRSDVFREQVEVWLNSQTGRVATKTKVFDCQRQLDWELRSRATAGQVHKRIAGLDGRVYVDLARGDGGLLSIGANGHRLVTDAPVAFQYEPGMQALPSPQDGGTIADIQNAFGLDDQNARVALAFMLAAMNPEGPYPQLAILGVPGSGKSTLARRIKALIDPGEAHGLPTSEHSLAAMAARSRVLLFDNVSTVKPKLSDALCRLSTGGVSVPKSAESGLSGNVERPAIFTAITDVFTQGDLRERLWFIELPAIGEGDRKTRAELDDEFKKAAPKMFGVLVNLISAGLRNMPQLELSPQTRMADAAKWVSACLKGSEWQPDDVLSALQQSFAAASASATEDSALLSAVVERVRFNGNFTGTMTELLEFLRNSASAYLKGRLPTQANAASRELKQNMETLKAAGVEMTQVRGSNRDGRRYQFKWIGDKQDLSVAAKADATPAESVPAEASASTEPGNGNDAS